VTCASGSAVAPAGLAVLGAPRDLFLGGYRTPSEKTIRLLLREIDVDALDAAFGGWL
jgi:hypothetical protein